MALPLTQRFAFDSLAGPGDLIGGIIFGAIDRSFMLLRFVFSPTWDWLSGLLVSVVQSTRGESMARHHGATWGVLAVPTGWPQVAGGRPVTQVAS
jgi:hypothetical protein